MNKRLVVFQSQASSLMYQLQSSRDYLSVRDRTRSKSDPPCHGLSTTSAMSSPPDSSASGVSLHSAPTPMAHAPWYGIAQPTEDARITLLVGEKYFYTRKETLAGSETLKGMLAERWSDKKEANSTYFLDMDPDVFTYILRFLRHDVYPLLYDNIKGHDFAIYAAIA
ncbi:MAG: hypothetical protein LQ348_004376 [Seirophora lacunosa]|nr:MAG: hypothetical protein LQ348_004376 [Seirophora lacunosa]